MWTKSDITYVFHSFTVSLGIAKSASRKASQADKLLTNAVKVTSEVTLCDWASETLEAMSSIRGHEIQSLASGTGIRASTVLI